MSYKCVHISVQYIGIYLKYLTIFISRLVIIVQVLPMLGSESSVDMCYYILADPAYFAIFIFLKRI